MNDNHNRNENKWVMWGFIGTVLACAIAMFLFMYYMSKQ